MSYLSTQPLIPVVRNEDGVWCYTNRDGKLIPMKACKCNIAYNPACPINEHAWRSNFESREILEIAGHILSKREQWRKDHRE